MPLNYGSPGADAAMAFQNAMMDRKKQQQEDLMTQLAVQKAQSDLLTAEQMRETSKEANKWAVEDRKAETELKKQKIHEGEVLELKRIWPADGFPVAPELRRRAIALNLDPDAMSKTTPAKPAQPLSFGPYQDAQLMLAPSATPGAPDVPSMGLPAQEAQPEQTVSTLPADDLRRMSPDAVEKELARRAAVADKQEEKELDREFRSAEADERAEERRNNILMQQQFMRGIAEMNLSGRQDIAAQKDYDKETARIAARTGAKLAAGDTIALIDQLTPKGELSPGLKDIVGASGLRGYRAMIPGTAGASAYAQLQRLVSTGIFNKMNELKAQSATGSTGLGPVSVIELQSLRDSVAALDPNMEEAAMLAELKRVKIQLNRIFEPDEWEKRALERPDLRSSASGQPPAAATAPPAPRTRPAGVKVERIQ